MNDGMLRYTFDFDDRQVIFDVCTDRKDSSKIVQDVREEAPDWALLEHQKCSCCPLKTPDCRYCPVALRIDEVLTAFSSNNSTDRARVTVETPERNFFRDCDLQVGINSLLGTMMATSGCPILGQLGAMASFHIPFCTTQETLNRTVGSYLTRQYFVQLEGGEPDWDLEHLRELYDVLGVLNQDFFRRIRSSINSDAVSNAVIMFFATSVMVSTSLEQQLKKHQKYLTNDLNQCQRMKE